MRIRRWFHHFRFSRVALLVLIFAIPLYPKFPFFSVHGSYVAIRISDFLVVFAFLAFFLDEIRFGFPILRHQQLNKLFFFFWLAGFLANLNGLYLGGWLKPALAWLHWLRRWQYLGMFFVAREAIDSREDILWFLRSLALTVFLVFLYGLGQKYFGLPVISTMNPEFAQGILLHLDKWVRINATFAGHYDLAAWLAMLLPFILAASFAISYPWERLLFWVSFLAGFQLLIWTASRVSFVAYLLGVTISLWLLGRYRYWLLLLTLSIFWGLRSPELSARLTPAFQPLLVKISSPWHFRPYLSFLSARRGKLSQKRLVAVTPKPKVAVSPVSSPAKAVAAGSSARRRIIREVRTWPKPEEVQAAAQRSSAIRFQVEWPRALRAWAHNPLLGEGYSSLGLATDCDYLRLLGETGLLGFSAFILIILTFLKQFLSAWRQGSNRFLMAGFLGALLAFLANAVFIDVFEASKDAYYFWLLMGFGFVISRRFLQLGGEKKI